MLGGGYLVCAGLLRKLNKALSIVTGADQFSWCPVRLCSFTVKTGEVQAFIQNVLDLRQEQ